MATPAVRGSRMPVEDRARAFRPRCGACFPASPPWTNSPVRSQRKRRRTRSPRATTEIVAAEATATTRSHRQPPSGVRVAFHNRDRTRSWDRRSNSPGVTRTTSSSTVDTNLARRSSRNRTSSSGSEGTARSFGSDVVALSPRDTGSSPIIPTSVCHGPLGYEPAPPASPVAKRRVTSHCNGAGIPKPGKPRREPAVDPSPFVVPSGGSRTIVPFDASIPRIAAFRAGDSRPTYPHSPDWAPPDVASHAKPPMNEEQWCRD
jgi:hypothetical protein